MSDQKSQEADLELQEVAVQNQTSWTEEDGIPPEKPLGAGGIILLILLFPFLLILFLLIFLVFLFTLPFRSCMHYHSASAKNKPTDSVPPSDGTSWIQSERTGMWLFCRSWLPAPSSGVVNPAKPRGVVYVCHGFGEHTGRAGYATLASRLNAAGFAVHAVDHQGHGRSSGDRAFFERIDDVISDFWHFAIETDKKNKYENEVQRFFFGHSLGGLISLSAACEGETEAFRSKFPSWQLSGIVLSSPCLAIDPNLATPALRAASKMLSYVLPKLVLKGLPPTVLSRNAAAVEAYTKDPLVFSAGVRARVGAEMIAQMALTLKEVKKFDKPMLLVHGTKDGEERKRTKAPNRSDHQTSLLTCLALFLFDEF
jgi:acylglycerol lipase